MNVIVSETVAKRWWNSGAPFWEGSSEGQKVVLYIIVFRIFRKKSIFLDGCGALKSTQLNLPKNIEMLTTNGIRSIVQLTQPNMNLEVVVVVYLTTNQRHLGYLSSGNGHLAGRCSTP